MIQRGHLDDLIAAISGLLRAFSSAAVSPGNPILAESIRKGFRHTIPQASPGRSSARPSCQAEHGKKTNLSTERLTVLIVLL